MSYEVPQRFFDKTERDRQHARAVSNSGEPDQSRIGT